MIIKLKNKDTLIIDNFKLKCCVGKGGLKKNKIEGDGATPKGKFSLGKLLINIDTKKSIHMRGPVSNIEEINIKI